MFKIERHFKNLEPKLQSLSENDLTKERVSEIVLKEYSHLNVFDSEEEITEHYKELRNGEHYDLTDQEIENELSRSTDTELSFRHEESFKNVTIELEGYAVDAGLPIEDYCFIINVEIE